MSRVDRPTLILAIALSLFLWAYVRLWHETPEITRVIRDVPVQLGSGPAGFECKLHPKDQTVDVYVKGPAERVNNVIRDDIVIRANVTGTLKSRMTVMPEVKLPKWLRLGREVEVTVLTNPLKQKTLPVTISFITQPPPGTTVGQYKATPNSVSIEGGQEALDKVHYVIVRIDPTQAMTTDQDRVPHPVSADGEPVDDVRVLTATVKVRMVSLTGQQTTRQMAVRQPVLKYQPRGYIVRIAQIRPTVVTLSGEDALLNRVQGYVETEPLDVHAVTRDTTVTARLQVPNGLSVIEGPTVRVDLEAQPVR